METVVRRVGAMSAAAYFAEDNITNLNPQESKSVHDPWDYQKMN